MSDPDAPSVPKAHGSTTVPTGPPSKRGSAWTLRTWGYPWLEGDGRSLAAVEKARSRGRWRQALANANNGRRGRQFEGASVLDKNGDEWRFLRDGGESGARMRAFDWASTSLGPPSRWPQSLRTSVRFMLTTRHPIFIFWGPESLCLFNDSYAQVMGAERRAGALGRPAREVWAEAWHVAGPQIDQVMAGGGATWNEDQLVPINRDGKLDEVYWTYGYGPIDEESAPSQVGGVMVVVTETTGEGARGEAPGRGARAPARAASTDAGLRGGDARPRTCIRVCQRLLCEARGPARLRGAPGAGGRR